MLNYFSIADQQFPLEEIVIYGPMNFGQKRIYAHRDVFEGIISFEYDQVHRLLEKSYSDLKSDLLKYNSIEHEWENQLLNSNNYKSFKSSEYFHQLLHFVSKDCLDYLEKQKKFCEDSKKAKFIFCAIKETYLSKDMIKIKGICYEVQD